MSHTNGTDIDRQAEQVILGTGPLGLAVMDALVTRGYTNITLVNRRGAVDEPLPASVRVMAGDVTDPDDVARLAAQAAAVFQCAQPGYTEWPEKFPPIIRGVVEGISRTGARLIVGDNLYMYGPTHGAPITEDLPYAAAGKKGRTRAEMAQYLLDAHQSGTVRVAIGRASDFYGPRVEGSAVGDIVFEAVLAGKAVNTMGNIDLPHTYTYIRDFGEALVTLAEHDEALGQVWHVPSAPASSTREFVEMVGQAAGQPVKIRTAGRGMLTMIGLFVPDMREMKEMYYEFAEPHVVDDSKFRRAFGGDPTPLAEGIAATVDWYRSRQN
ncbi:MAG: NAD-dependent epimerase/dehydratase family protein [Caldilineales bacterium]